MESSNYTSNCNVVHSVPQTFLLPMADALLDESVTADADKAQAVIEVLLLLFVVVCCFMIVLFLFLLVFGCHGSSPAPPTSQEDAKPFQ